MILRGEDVDRIYLEVLHGEPAPSADTDEEREFREALTAQVQEILDRGGRPMGPS